MKEMITINIPDGYEFYGIDDKGNVTLAPKQTKYPQTIDDCYNNLSLGKKVRIARMIPCDYALLLEDFSKLLICRDAYWKLAGEEMGWDKPWAPDYSDTLQVKYTICYVNGKISRSFSVVDSTPLSFPTEEMRDFFYENFIDLIEQCKEFL